MCLHYLQEWGEQHDTKVEMRNKEKCELDLTLKLPGDIILYGIVNDIVRLFELHCSKEYVASYVALLGLFHTRDSKGDIFGSIQKLLPHLNIFSLRKIDIKN